jgi:hypothetical protein
MQASTSFKFAVTVLGLLGDIVNSCHAFQLRGPVLSKCASREHLSQYVGKKIMVDR